MVFLTMAMLSSNSKGASRARPYTTPTAIASIAAASYLGGPAYSDEVRSPDVLVLDSALGVFLDCLDIDYYSPAFAKMQELTFLAVG